MRVVVELEPSVGRSLSERIQTHPSHQDNSVYAHLPLLGQHLLCVPPEGFGIGRCLARLFRFEELFGLGETNANKTNANRNAG